LGESPLVEAVTGASAPASRTRYRTPGRPLGRRRPRIDARGHWHGPGRLGVRCEDLRRGEGSGGPVTGRAGRRGRARQRSWNAAPRTDGNRYRAPATGRTRRVAAVAAARLVEAYFEDGLSRVSVEVGPEQETIRNGLTILPRRASGGPQFQAPRAMAASETSYALPICK